jgi:hypothetical protein
MCEYTSLNYIFVLYGVTVLQDVTEVGTIYQIFYGSSHDS